MGTSATDRPWVAAHDTVPAHPWYVVRYGNGWNVTGRWFVERAAGWECRVALTPALDRDDAAQAAHARAVADALNRVYARAV